VRKCLVALMVITIALMATAGFASTAEARSYTANAVNKVNHWAKNLFHNDWSRRQHMIEQASERNASWIAGSRS